MSYIGKIQIDGSTLLPIGSTLYGTASVNTVNSPTGYVANDGTLANIDTLLTGLTIFVKFSGSNTISSPTLTVGSTQAKYMHRVAGTAIGTSEDTSWPANAIVSFTYDGTYWVMNSTPSANTTYTFSEGSTDGTIAVSVNGGTATDVSVHGLGSAAYTDSTDYATSAQGTKADDAMPKSGGEFSGNVTFASGKTLTVNSPTADAHAASKKYVDDSFSNAIGVATSAMVFKGTIGSQSGATVASLPTTGYVAGWTYRVVGSYTFGSGADAKVCEDGDIIIAITSNSSGSSSITPADWTVAQVNIDGAVTTTGSTSGYIAKFNGTNTITGLAVTNGGTRFLQEDGDWATPTDTHYTSSGSADALTSLNLTYNNGTSHTNAVTNSSSTPVQLGEVVSGVLHIKSIYYGTTSVSTGIQVDNS